MDVVDHGIVLHNEKLLGRPAGAWAECFVDLAPTCAEDKKTIRRIRAARSIKGVVFEVRESPNPCAELKVSLVFQASGMPRSDSAPAKKEATPDG